MVKELLQTERGKLPVYPVIGSSAEGRNYPYAELATYCFLKAAINEGAHLRLPQRLEKYTNGWERWVHKRNIAGIYFSTRAVEDEIGAMFNYPRTHRSNSPNRREIIRKHVKTFIKMLWENCSQEIQKKFSLENIPLSKPETSVSLRRRGDASSVAQGGAKFRVLAVYSPDRKLKEIAAMAGVSLESASKIINREQRRKSQSTNPS